MAEQRINPKAFVKALDNNWSLLAKDLGEDWVVFLAAYRAIIQELPVKPTTRDVEAVLYLVRAELAKYKPGRQFLRLSQSVEPTPEATRDQLPSPREVLLGIEELPQICNRLKMLASVEPSSNNKTKDQPVNSTSPKRTTSRND